MTVPVFPDTLAQRYAGREMRACWSVETKVRLERDFWIAVMKAQRDLGVAIPEEAISDYERVRDDVDLDSISLREQRLRHDVKARIEEFCELAGRQYIHMGMTSRDLTDNVEQLQLLRGLKLLRVKYVAGLQRLADWSLRTRTLMLVGRTHNVPAQPTTVGKRLAMFGEEILFALEQIDSFIDAYPLRGLQGAVGTSLDQSALFEGDAGKVRVLSEKVMQYLGASEFFVSVGQVYPRSLDEQTLAKLMAVSAGISSFAKTLRLMAGAGLATEGFQQNQVGSSAMPHKKNARTCERICGFHHVLQGFHSMLAGLTGDQWNEGDVSCSVVRRVALPGAFFAADGQLEAWMTVIQEMGFHEEALQQEFEENLPYVASTVLLMECVRRGGGREDAHTALREHTLLLSEKTKVSETNPLDELIRRLSEDQRIPLNEREIRKVLEERERFAASAPDQADAFVEKAASWSSRFPESRDVSPEPLL